MIRNVELREVLSVFTEFYTARAALWRASDGHYKWISFGEKSDEIEDNKRNDD